MRSLLKTLLLATSLLAISPLKADTLTMPEATPPQDVSVQVPGRGMTMTAVEEKFGSPDTKYDEVGDPPITRWDYPQFSVYFEYQYVIHSVVKVTP
ncbi:MAG: hypothetical protein P8Y24_08975 [Gammaproteobacteria bacterium]|jgi:hypothetical protein